MTLDNTVVYSCENVLFQNKAILDGAIERMAIKVGVKNPFPDPLEIVEQAKATAENIKKGILSGAAGVVEGFKQGAQKAASGVKDTVEGVKETVDGVVTGAADAIDLGLQVINAAVTSGAEHLKAIFQSPHLLSAYVPSCDNKMSFALRTVGCSKFASIWLDVKEQAQKCKFFI